MLWLATGPCGAGGWQDTHVLEPRPRPRDRTRDGRLVRSWRSSSRSPPCWSRRRRRGSPGEENLARLLGLAAGAGILAVGAAIWVDGSAATRGGLAILTGLAFVAPAWEAWPRTHSLFGASRRPCSRSSFRWWPISCCPDPPDGSTDTQSPPASSSATWSRQSRRSRSRWSGIRASILLPGGVRLQRLPRRPPDASRWCDCCSRVSRSLRSCSVSAC